MRGVQESLGGPGVDARGLRRRHDVGRLCRGFGRRHRQRWASGNGGGTAGAIGCDAPTQVFQVGCALAACHDAVTRQAELDLSGDPYAALVNKPPARNTQGVTFCEDSGYLVIDSQAPEQSLLYLKQQQAPPCGVGMPFPLGPMDNGAAASCVLSWIRSRAQ